MLEELRELNFRCLIELKHSPIRSYSFEEYRSNGYRHPEVLSYCISCEEEGWNVAKDGSGFQLKNISHGAHAEDFFKSLKESVEGLGEWHKEPIMFVFESPSVDYKIYESVKYKGYAKRPSKDWYWVHEERDMKSFPEYFKGRVYSEFVLSVMSTFRLSNVYMTNLIKCGMNNEDGTRFKGIDAFRNDCIKNCYKRFLRREIEIIKPKVIFAVGSKVGWWLKHLKTRSSFIQHLPHPAARGFRDEYYKVLYFWLVLGALKRTSIIKVEEATELAQVFVERFDQK